MITEICFLPVPSTHGQRPLLARLLAGVLRADARYRDRRLLLSKSGSELADIGMTRADLRAAFCRGEI